jgi:hypothetical protein
MYLFGGILFPLFSTRFTSRLRSAYFLNNFLNTFRPLVATFTRTPLILSSVLRLLELFGAFIAVNVTINSHFPLQVHF